MSRVLDIQVSGFRGPSVYSGFRASELSVKDSVGYNIEVSMNDGSELAAHVWDLGFQAVYATSVYMSSLVPSFCSHFLMFNCEASMRVNLGFLEAVWQ